MKRAAALLLLFSLTPACGARSQLALPLGNATADGGLHAGFEVRSIGVGDFDGNGSADVVMANYTGGSIEVFSNRGDGTFAPRVSTPS
jgi:hypothetical protein